jgi:hypothetical protein
MLNYTESVTDTELLAPDLNVTRAEKKITFLAFFKKQNANIAAPSIDSINFNLKSPITGKL